MKIEILFEISKKKDVISSKPTILLPAILTKKEREYISKEIIKLNEMLIKSLAKIT